MAIIKRDGSTEDYSEEKMKKFLNWAVEGTHCAVDTLYGELTIPTKDTSVDEVLREIVDVSEKLASRITPGWLKVAGRVYAVDLIKQHRAAGFDLINPYPDYSDTLTFLTKQLHTATYATFSFSGEDDETIFQEWVKVFEEASDLEYDYSLPINNMRMLCERQARKYNGVNESPSLVLLRQSVAASEYETGKYDPIHALAMLRAAKGRTGAADSPVGPALFTHATPMSIHAGKATRSTGSCTLLTTADDSSAIMDTASQLALHSKHGSGNGIDVSAIAASGRYIRSTEGKSSGVRPFLKIYEAILKGFNQSGKREGAGVVTFRFWHLDFEELIYLKNTTGEPESRIRGLKYAMCTHDILYTSAAEGRDVALVCPTEAEKFFGDDRLLKSYGAEFKAYYIQIIEAIKAGKVPGKIVPARWIFGEYFKNAYNHGNLYETNLDNINKQNMLDKAVYSSNLCTEVMIPSRYELSDSALNPDVIKTGLCFLNSTNSAAFAKLSSDEQLEQAYIQVKALDNQIETDFYPVPHTTEDYAKRSRFIGVGLSNLATFFAERNLRWDSQEALEAMDKFMDDWSYAVISASVRLAKERGAAPDFFESKWADGTVPIDLSNNNAWVLTQYKPDTQRWALLKQDVARFGVRNCLMMALAPTASSGAAAGLTEGQDPVDKHIFTRSGDIPVTHVHSFDPQVLNQFDLGFSIPNEAIIKLAAVRQKWLDQAQSLSLYAKGSEFKMSEAFAEREMAHQLGIKSIYYTKFQKMDADICESCS